MSSSLFNTLKCLLVVAMLFCFKTGSAQDKYTELGFRIDSFANVGLPKSALQQVDRLDGLARKNNNAPQQIRAVIYRMTFQSYLEENALVAIISRLKTDIDNASYPVKPVLQSLLAQMYWNYYQQNRYQFSRRSKRDTASSDFTNWDLQTIINETGHLYELSLKDADKEQSTPVAVLDGVLEGDKSTRYLRPTLYDLLVNRAFDFFLSDEAAINKPRQPFSINDPRFFSDSHTFANLAIKTTDTASVFYKGIKYLQQATLFHLQKNTEEALADVDLKRLGFLFGKTVLPNKDTLYLKALQLIATGFVNRPISANALVLIGQYYQGKDSLVVAYSYFKKAMVAYPYSLYGKNAASLIKQIESKELSATVEDVNAPGKPIIALLNYKNVGSARMEIYRLSENQLIKYLSGDSGNYNFIAQAKYRNSFLKKFKPVKTISYKWNNIGDFRKQSVEVKIDALPVGNYVVVAKDGGSDDESLIGLANFKVSGLAYTARVNPDYTVEIRAMDRETGMPLKNVKILVHGKHINFNTVSKKTSEVDTIETGFTDKQGLLILNEITSSNNLSISLSINGDSLQDKSKYISGAVDNSDYDEPVDKTVLFTDRQIYRPGQTIYFKALQIQTQSGKSKIMPDKEIGVEFIDVNYKQVSTLLLKTNEFGTANGSFIIPQNMLDGNVSLKTDNGDLSVKVEEYKRPTFQIAFSPVKESYKPDDSVTLKGTVTAFSGYGLSQAKVAYHVTRSQNRIFIKAQYGRAMYGSKYAPEVTEIKVDTTITDNLGNYEIKFKATPGETNNLHNPNYVYAVNADVTDGSGETHSAETSVTVGFNNVTIVNNFPGQLLAKDSINVPVSINNLNGQLQKGIIKVEVYALKNPGQIFKSRLWPVPAQFVMNKTEFKNSFPDYAYQNEDIVSSWQRLNKIESVTVKVDGEKSGIIKLEELKKQPSGVYQIVISARTGKGDTTSVTKYVDLINGQAKPVKFDEWVIPLLNEVKPGDTAKFLLGINQKINVLVERYNGSKLIASDWITVDKDQQVINVPVNDANKNLAIQFMMVYHNRLYTSYQRIYIANNKYLKVKFLTFRDKLQPGEKEQWKLQITNENNEKQAAEMLAGLYDASLDDITPPQNWHDILSTDGQYNDNYFAWSSFNFVNASNTSPLAEVQNYTAQLSNDYERLNLFGYNYFGGYNYGYRDFLTKVQQHLAVVENDKRLSTEYNKNSALVKKGYDITGMVISSDDKLGMPGVVISIKGSKINTTTYSKGYFKIKVPINATLIFSSIGYLPKEVRTTKEEQLTIKLESDPNQLHEAVVVGYGVQRKADLTGSVSNVRIRGNSTLAKNLPLADSERLFQGMAAGVQVVDDSVNQVSLSPKPIIPRTNFNETAFFYPQLRTNEKGEIAIEFTIPEALTRWKFRGFAHTKDLETGYVENTVITQKQLSISANTPRFLREGDTITMSARLASLNDAALKGRVKLQLFNALNMQPVSLLVNKADGDQPFDIAGHTNKAVAFKLVVPAGLDALTYRLTADAGQYTDGEENTLPVLPNRMLVTESMPMMVRAGQTRNFTFDKLVNQNSTTLQNKTLTLEYTQNPAWYAVQALPCMMEFPYECSEQVFSRYYANSLATDIVTKMPVIKRVFDQWKSSNSTELLSNLEKNQQLKATLIEETPWLKEAVSESEQKKRIALLFDLNKMTDELKLNLDKLQKRQLPDGGFPWFGGERGDRFITQHILEGIGELNHVGIGTNNTDLDQIATNALNFQDNRLLEDDKVLKKNKDYTTRTLDDLEIHAWFARSYFLNKPISADVQKLLSNYITRATDQWTLRNVYEQGLIALTMQRYKKPEVTAQIEKSLLETAQISNDLGMYWARNQAGYFWYQSPVETQSLLIELFTEAGNNTKAVDEMKIWLLRNKQTSNWRTTKATAAACYALLLKGNNVLADSGSTKIKLNGKLLETLKPEVKADAGTGYIKTSWVDEQIKPALGKVEIQNNSTSISWGALHWQYLENLDKITSSQTNIHLERKYFILKQTDAGPVLTTVDATHQPKTGDLLKVVVYLKADRDFEYVQLKDMRPAGTEPVDALSEYKYQDGLYYYQVSKDVATNFFISYLAKGNYVFEYQLRVAQPGNFSTGITNVQSMYAPEFNAHSQGSRMVIK